MTIKSMDSCLAEMYMIMGQSMRPRSFCSPYQNLIEIQSE